MVAIIPSNGDQWSCATVAVLLNERSPQWSFQDFTRLYVASGASRDSYYTFVCCWGGQLPRAHFVVKLHPHEVKKCFRITVEAEMNWLSSDDWTRHDVQQMTRLRRAGIRDLKKAKMKPFVGFSFPLPQLDNLRPTTQAIWRRESLLVLRLSAVSNRLLNFARRCVMLSVPRTRESQF
jgi:hypothetical protein